MSSAGADPKPRLSLLRSVTVEENGQQPRQQVSVPITMCHGRSGSEGIAQMAVWI